MYPAHSNLLEVSHELLHAKDNGYSSRLVFLDISKAFYKVVHSGLVSGSFWNLMEPYLQPDPSLCELVMPSLIFCVRIVVFHKVPWSVLC